MREEQLRGEVERVTVYMRAEHHRALKVEAAQTGKSMSEIVNEALRLRAQAAVQFTRHGG